MKCDQCQKEKPDSEVTTISAAWANVMVIAHMFMGTYLRMKQNPRLFPRYAGDHVCRECRLVCAVVLTFAALMMLVVGGVILWA